ncbi:hypothetical protein BDV38DRAFT_286892 [Aspergillus pseudotamarii]|uniref:Uncharacterized protein n=1 Tax=Aspergillus pseudotamarii TaxID=132259 RepID=A0A5N6SHE6_ASPPS|nr:uncharacterized protein BDV38DRAFT_286892 [Aspergillus pseudotamarii]KAE8133299.1 hypothetical protein BDV38DRAFT_286892 [Aspergillus pseudotamarii]
MSGFDWTEDAEEALEQQHERLKSNANPARETEVDDISDEYSDTDTPISSQQGADISPVWGGHRHADDLHGKKCPVGEMELETPFGVVPVSEHYRLSMNPLPHIDEDQEDDIYYNYEDSYETTQMKSEVEQEFIFRNYCMEHDEARQIHHFNWLGYPIYEPSGTPPAISLLFQLADPKMPNPRDELRIQSIFARAMMFIDPVIVELEKGLEDLDREGFDLVRWATGRVTRFYSLHGRWTDDRFEWEECRTPDKGILEQYQSGSVACGNGFISLCNIRSRYQWGCHKAQLQEKYEKACHVAAEKFYIKRQCKVYKPSLLSQSMSLKILDCTAEDHTETISDSSIHEQEYDGISVGSLEESVEGHCDVQRMEIDANDRREGTQQTKSQRFEICTTDDQITDAIETCEDWQAVVTSQIATDSTDTWEALSRTPNGGRKKVSIKKGRFARWKANLKAWRVTLKGLMAKRCRLVCIKAQNVLRKRDFAR